MSNINLEGQFNLTNFVHFFKKFKSKEGKEVDCIVIPLENNHLSKTEKGNVIAFFRGFTLKNQIEGGNTHILNHSVKKEIREALKAADEYPATLGNAKAYIWNPESQPQTTNDFDPGAEAASADEGDNLPF